MYRSLHHGSRSLPSAFSEFFATRLRSRRSSFIRSPALMSLVAVLVFGLCGWCAESKAQSKLFPAAKAIENNNDEAGWRRLEKPLADLQAALEEQAEQLPYAQRSRMASPELFRKVMGAGQGIHSLWRDFRIVSPEPPPQSSYINRCAAVIKGDLRADENSPANLRKPKDYRKRWDGYIHSSIVIVDGAMEIDGYILDSIVVCTGPIKLHSYIANSLVVSTYAGDQFAVDTANGYISQSIVAAKKCRPGSARDCVIFGEVEGTDLRAAKIKSWHFVREQIESLGLPAQESPGALPLEPGLAKPKVAQKLLALLTAEDQLNASMLAEQLTDAVLTKEQVDTLIENAKSTTSDARRNALWHAIRLSRDIGGRQYLRETLGNRSSKELQIQFIQSMKNPSIEDVPLFVAIYQSADNEPIRGKSENAIASPTELDDVREQVMRIASIDWKRMVLDISRDPEMDSSEATRQRQIYERRQDRALEGQASLLRWLVRHGATDSHRLQAFAVVRRITSWPNEGKWHEETRLDEDLLASSRDPGFRVKVLDQFGTSLQLSRFLDPEEGEVDAVRIAAIRAIGRSILMENGAPIRYSGQYDLLLQRTAERDEATKVREAASQLLVEIRERMRQP